jgi:hypothetical protein
MYRILTVIVAATVLPTMIACGPREGRQARSPEDLLARAVSDSVAANPVYRSERRLVSDSLRVRIDSSQAVAGLLYYSGYFTPPRTVDVSPFVSKAVSWRARTRILEAPQDWTAVVGPTGWRPQRASDAILACKEVVLNTPPTSEGRYRELFLDTTELHHRFVVPDMRILAAGARTPRAELLSDSSWRVTMWVVEQERTVEYRCMLSGVAVRPLELELTRIDSLPGVGFLGAPW